MDLEVGTPGVYRESKSVHAHTAGWNGPDDPENPRNWKPSMKLRHIILVSLFALYSSLATVMFAPGAAQLADDFRITSSTIVTFTVSIYILGYVLGPLFLSPMSELYGRLIIYRACGVVYTIVTVGCALSTNTAMFLVFRFICGCAASAPLVITGGTIADLYVPSERGTAMALACIGPLLGPALGPVIGGFVARDLGWRWTFWFILILAGAATVATFFLMKETFEPALLKRRATIAQTVSDSNGAYVTGPSPTQLLKRTAIRPLRILFLSPVVFLLSLYTGFIYGLIYVLFTTFPDVYIGRYGFTTELSGLVYLGLGLGMLVSLMFCIFLGDRLMANGTTGRSREPERRLLPMLWFSLVLPVGFFWYGWSAYKAAPWIVTILGTLLIGVGSMMILIPVQSYLVDAFDCEAAASAIAAATIVRSLFGAFLPLTSAPLYRALGLGWGNSLLGFIALTFSPVPYLFYRYGERLRAQFTIRL